jgi:general secretion pathway protein F
LPGLRSAIIAEISRVPGISAVFNFYRTALFCRNLSILLRSDVTLSATLRILVDSTGWSQSSIITISVVVGGLIVSVMTALAAVPGRAV